MSLIYYYIGKDMGFSDNIFKITGGICPCSYRITVCGSNGVYVEGVLKMIDVSDNKIIIAVKGGKLKIFGENLKITSYFERDISISGEIIKIEKERGKQ